MPTQPELALGSWAVVCVQQDQWVARGTLSGLGQTNDKAELQAVRMALDLTTHFDGEVVIWSDSAYATSGLHRLLQNIEDAPEDHGDGMRVEIQSLVRFYTYGRLLVQHIASHRCSWKEDDPVDEWTAAWNDRADREAGAAQMLRGQEFMVLRDNLL